MKLESRVIDDMKTERAEIAPPLPATFRLVPLGFFLSVAGTIILCGFFAWQLHEASASRDAWKAQTEETKQAHRATRAERRQLEEQAKRASDILAWVESSRGLQPLIVDIARSMEPESSLTQLSLVRDGNNATQVRLALRMNSQGLAQLDQTLESIFRKNYRAYSPQQTLARGEVDYQATLIWQDPQRHLATDE